MAKEIELKLRLAPEDTGVLAQWLDAHCSAQGESPLNNEYYDTPDLLLQRNRAALRVRQTPDGYEQTLKTRGRSVAGVHIRGEWNWPVSGPGLDLSLLTSGEVADSLPEGSDIEGLQPVFGTHFRRRRWLWDSNGCRVEVVIDQGEVRAGGASQPLCETELELLAGDVSDLWQLLLTMQAQAPLWLSDVSKAERGYRQAGKTGFWLPPQVRDPDWPEYLSSSLRVIQRASEDSLWGDDPLSLHSLWLAAWPLAQVLESQQRPLFARLLQPLSPHSRLGTAQALTQLSHHVYELCSSSQDGPDNWREQVSGARSTVADVIECGDDLLKLIRD